MAAVLIGEKIMSEASRKYKYIVCILLMHKTVEKGDIFATFVFAYCCKFLRENKYFIFARSY